ncbi:MAG: PilZ domain-containing protein [Candidatus Aureabacteria bacterium]|nr:PilZ domain-containing protein [Candidatus Auribacterota bacterium]
MNRRRYQRTPTQYFTKFAFINDKLAIESPPGMTRAVIENISFGGISLIIIPEIEPDIRKRLKDGKLNIYLDFNLPPSLKQIEITGKVKWIKDKSLNKTRMSVVGVEFINKNKVLFKEIDDFIKSDGKGPLLKNKRRFPRIPSNINVKFSVRKFKNVGLFSTMHEGFVNDLSAGGMSMIVAPPLKKGYINSLLQRKKYLFLKFFLPDNNRFLSLTGLPTRIRNIKINDKTATYMGIRFINITESDQHELIEFICHKKSCFVRENVIDQNSSSKKPKK